MPPNQVERATRVTPSTARMRLSYDAGRKKASEIALRVIRRALEAAAAPAYHASTTVRSRPNASTSMASPVTVSSVRSRWRKALRTTSLRRNKQLALLEVHQRPGRFRPVRIVRHHDDGLAELAVEALHHRQDVGSRDPVEVAGRLVGDDDGRIGDHRAGDRHALLLPAGELVRVVLHAIGKPDHRQHQLDAR